MHALRPRNTESGELKINKIGEKLQDKTKFIINNNPINERLNQSTYMVQ